MVSKGLRLYFSAGRELVAVDQCNHDRNLIIFVGDVRTSAGKQVLQAVQRAVVVRSVTVTGSKVQSCCVLDG